MEHTENFQLSQWEAADRIQMQDFNADNAKIDAALAGLAAASAKHGNCLLRHFTYVGKGTASKNNPTRLTFSRMPMFALILSSDGRLMPLLPGMSHSVTHGPDGGWMSVSWSNLTASWYSVNGASPSTHLDGLNEIYHVLAFYLMDEE